MTIAIAPSALSLDLLALRLRELAGEERDLQVDFLLHLDEFDRRRAFLEAGFGSLWEYCLRALHLREGPAGRRIAAMRVLRHFPALEPALRDGRLGLSTVTLVAPLLTEQNLEEVVARAAFRTKAEVEHLVASMQPRAAPKDGLRRRAESPVVHPTPPTDEQFTLTAAPGVTVAPTISACTTTAPEAVVVAAPLSTLPLASVARPAAARPPVELRPTSAEEWSLRVTLDAGMKADLDTLKALLGHKAGGDLAAVVREALRCAVERHGKRRGAVRPTRTRTVAAPRALDVESMASGQTMGESRPASTREKAAASTASSRHVAAAVRRAVWERDGGRCAWTSSDGRRCGSTWKLELDHVVPVARGGRSTIANLRLTCRAHNVLHAEEVFGREHMARFARPRAPADAQGSLIPG